MHHVYNFGLHVRLIELLELRGFIEFKLNLSKCFSIWEHLCQVVKNGRTTVIVTTHYTEEIRRSNMVSFVYL